MYYHFLCWSGKSHLCTLATLGCILLELFMFSLLSLPWDLWLHFKHHRHCYTCPSARQTWPLWSVIIGKEMIFYVLLCRYQCKSLPFRNISSPINQNTSNWQACHHLPISELHMKSLRFTLKVTDFDFCLTLKGLHQPQKLIRPYQVFL